MEIEAEITSPVMRFITVRSIPQSVAFYRDVLGFEITEDPGGSEATLGPARLRLEKEGRATSEGREARPAGSSVMFFQVDNIVSKRNIIQLRGGHPSAMERVNWIKQSVFEVRDPDGNVLWFGESYHHGQDSPSRGGLQPKGIRQALPELPFDNVPAAVTYYCDVLGFRINYQQDDLGVMDRDAITILLIRRTGQHSGIGSFGTYVDDVDTLYAELSEKGAQTQGTPISYPWGLRSFTVLDLEGNRITFSQTFE